MLRRETSGSSLSVLLKEMADAPYLAAVKRARENPEEYWSEVAEQLVWYKRWDKTLDSSKWFSGGELNACYNAVDRHVESGHGDDVAIKYDSPQTGDIRYITYNDLHIHVSKLAGVLAQLGVRKGDRVLIYMATVPESIIASLACARIGAIHVQVFGGFPVSVLVERLNHAEPKVLITSTYGMDGNQVVQYQPKVEAALSLSHHIPEKCIVYIRPGQPHQPLVPGRDVSWQDSVKTADPHSCIPVEATEPLCIIYTSGTTGLPKGMVMCHGGYTVGAQWCTIMLCNAERGDTVWANSNMGWALGHGVGCYGTLLVGATTLLYEGNASGTPDASAFYRLISDHKVNCFLSSPAHFRDLRKVDPEARLKGKHKLDSLRSVFIAGEVCDAVTSEWTSTYFGPCHEVYGQTEVLFVSSHLPHLRGSLGQAKDSAGVPWPGYEVCILRDDQTPCKPGEVGHIVLKLPLPPISFTTLYKNHELFVNMYYSKFPGYHDTKDSGWLDKDGYLFFDARTDDEIKVLGHRLPATLFEKAIMNHPCVAECVVIGLPDYRTGQKPVILFVLKTGMTTSSQIEDEIRKLAMDRTYTNIIFENPICVPVLPKNVNGKILRRGILDMLQKSTFEVPHNAENKDDFFHLKAALKKSSLGEMLN